MGNSRVCIIGTLIKSPNLVYENLQTIQFLLSCKKLEHKVDTAQHTLREIYNSVELDEKDYTPQRKRSSHAQIEQEPALDEIQEESESLISVQTSHRERESQVP